MATISNNILFIPFGFLSAIVFKRSQTKWIYGILIGLLFTSLLNSFKRLLDDLFKLTTLYEHPWYISWVYLCIYGLKFKPLKPLKRITD